MLILSMMAAMRDEAANYLAYTAPRPVTDKRGLGNRFCTSRLHPLLYVFLTTTRFLHLGLQNIPLSLQNTLTHRYKFITCRFLFSFVEHVKKCVYAFMQLFKIRIGRIH